MFNHIQLDVLQRIYYKLIEHHNLNNPTSLISIKLGYAAEHINPWLQLIQTKSASECSEESPIAFHTIVHADGVGSPSLKQLADKINQSLEYNQTPLDGRREREAVGYSQSAYLTISHKILGIDFTTTRIEGPVRFIDDQLKVELKKLGWEHDFLPKTDLMRSYNKRKIKDSTVIKVYVSGLRQ